MLKPLQEEAKKLGLWHVESPAEWGGAGLNLLGQAWSPKKPRSATWGLYPGLPRLRLRPAERDLPWPPGSDREVRRPGDRDGEKTFVAISEPSGGSDPAAPSDARREEGDRYILNGTKIWISGVGEANWGLVFARTGAKGRDGITAFIVEKKFEGFTTSRSR